MLTHMRIFRRARFTFVDNYACNVDAAVHRVVTMPVIPVVCDCAAHVCVCTRSPSSSPRSNLQIICVYIIFSSSQEMSLDASILVEHGSIGCHSSAAPLTERRAFYATPSRGEKRKSKHSSQIRKELNFIRIKFYYDCRQSRNLYIVFVVLLSQSTPPVNLYTS